jgi:hypothetical protein
MKTFPISSTFALAAALGTTMLSDTRAAEPVATPSVVLVHGAFADGSTPWQTIEREAQEDPGLPHPG